MPPLAAIPGATAAAIGGAASVAGAGISAAAGGGGGGGPQSQYYLPPELEVQYLDFFQNQLGQLQDMMAQNQSLQDVYNQRAEIAENASRGAIPSEQAMQQLTGTATNIAMLAGRDVEDLIKNGYMTELDRDLLSQSQQELSALRNLEGQQATDPRIENQLKDQRRQLEQDLARQGVGPAQRAIALSQFERQASELRFSTSQELIQNQFQRGLGRLGAIGGISQQGLAARQFGQAQTGQAFSQLQAQALAGQQAAQGYAGLLQQRFGIGQQGFQNQLGLLSQQQGAYTTTGQFGFSKPTQQLLGAGAIGPGTLFQQTGVPTQGTGANLRNVQKAENRAFKDQTGLNAGQLPGQLQFTTGSGRVGVRAEELQQALDRFYFR